MKKSVYKSAMSKLKTSEDFHERTLEKLQVELQQMNNHNSNKGEMNMKKANRKKTIIGWTAGLAACAVISLGVYSNSQSGTSDITGVNNPPGVTAKPSGVSSKPPGVTAKQMVNIDGIISEVSEDGQSFKVGDLWVTVTKDTEFGITGPTAPEPSEQLLEKEFKVGNAVSGYTAQDVTSGKVTADHIYNNFAVQN
ncbi:hypothetical protein EBB07_09090 [Paenibacillaceae bacterium]|nr:hypothetical protein EBB07_09090 [Paenibacillaceae bacterium]